ncbi:phospholipase D family protein [Serratia fonticola]|uniref:phospholipase D family nuclease n=1 Tax=Serratia fonticola TaxID=47917 RepID=UPI00301C0957
MHKYFFLTLAITMASPAMATEAPTFSVGFSPSHDALNVILSAINGAKHHIDVAAYSFTSKPVAAALVATTKRGVAVRVVADEKANNDRYTAVTFLANQDVPVRLDARYAIMHNKFMVIDDSAIETGSFNYSASAVTRNAENALLIENTPELATAYQGEFTRLWKESTPVQPRY